MPEADEGGQRNGLVERASHAIETLAFRARRTAGRLLAAAAIVGGSSWLLGLAATSGIVRSVWLVLGGVAAAVGIGAAYWSHRSLGMVIDRATAIRRSIGQLLDRTSDGDVAELVTRADDERLGLIRRIRLVAKLRSAVTSAAGEFQDLSLALAALARFPAAVALAVGSMVVLGALGLVFLVVLSA